MWPCIISLKVQSFLLYYFETNLSIVKLLLMKIAWKVVLWSSKDEEIAFIRVFTFSCIPCGLISLGWHCQKNNVKKWAFGKTVYSGGSGDGSGWPYNGGGENCLYKREVETICTLRDTKDTNVTDLALIFLLLNLQIIITRL